KNANVIDGSGGSPRKNADVLIHDDTIAEIGENLDGGGAIIVELSGKTIMPALISAHVHVGVLNGTTTSATHYTRENILAQLKKYSDFGVLNLQTMGTDRPLLFQHGLYDSIRTGMLP